VKVFIDGVDLTERFEVKSENEIEDVASLISNIAARKICNGIAGFTKDDLFYFPNATLRAGHFFSEDCPVVSESEGFKNGNVCDPCLKVSSELNRRDDIAKAQAEAKPKRYWNFYMHFECLCSLGLDLLIVLIL